MMGYISLWAIDAAGKGRFTGTQQEKLLIFGLFGVLLTFGFWSFVTGLWQVVTGRRNKILAWLVVGLGLLISIGGGAVAVFFK